jgi:hypothetical protein
LIIRIVYPSAEAFEAAPAPIVPPPVAPVYQNPNTAYPVALLAARRERPRSRSAAEQRDEIASFQLIELHSTPASQGRVAGYRIASDQSAGMLEFCKRSWFCGRPPATHSAR